MKKVVMTALLPLIIAGCGVGLRPSDPAAIPQPAVKLEDRESRTLQIATQDAMRDIQRIAPWLFKDHKSFIIGSAVEQGNFSQTTQLGRALGANLTKAIGTKAQARQISYRDNMLRFTPNMQGYLGLSDEATQFAQRMNADALVVMSYQLQGNIVTINMSFIRAADNYPMLQHSYSAMLDEKLMAFAQVR